MEIACPIPKLNPDKIKKSKWKSMELPDLVKKNTLEQFKIMVKSKKLEKISLEFCKNLFSSNQKEIHHALLMAYAISEYSEELFRIYKTKLEQKLFFFANQIIFCLESEDISDNFFEILDYYYALFKIWESHEILNKISCIFEELKENLELAKIKQEKILNNLILEKFNYLLELDYKYSIKILIGNYNIFINSEFQNYFWKKLEILYNQDQESIFLILITEIRSKLLFKLCDSQSRKDLYYKIDIEDLIKQIRESRFNSEQINKIILIILEKIKLESKINPENIILVFKNIFNYIFSN